MIYLDHNATTPIMPEVFEAMRPWLLEHYGNPSSVHGAGRLARQAIDTAREHIAALLNCQPGEIIFTSGGTESDNLALHSLLGVRRAYLVGATEHSAVLESAAAQAQLPGGERVLLQVDRNGLISDQTLRQALEATSACAQMVSIMSANNESGTIQDIQTLGKLAHDAGALMHSDAVQSAGKQALDFADLPVDLLSISAHKIYGPKGVGALIARAGLAIQPQMRGGSHENGRRAGTENLAGIVGFGKAAQLAKAELTQRQQHVAKLREAFEAGLSELNGITIFSQQVQRVANTCQLGVAGFHSEALMMELDKRGIAVASGSACKSGSGRPSHVLQAMGYDDEIAHSAIRVSFGQQNTQADVDKLLAALKQIKSGVGSGFAAGLFGDTP